MAIKRADEGAWIFLSHSNKDFIQVGRLRNELETQGHRPLMFFLKCLNDDSEIDDLIKREINARTWFIFCKSQNSKVSKWVRSEIAHVKSLRGKVYEEVDLDMPIATQVQAAKPLLRRASVFISYAIADRRIAQQLTNTLRAADFGVFTDLDLEPSTRWETEINSRLQEAVERGYVLIVITPDFIKSPFGGREALRALTWALDRKHRANVIPIYVGIRPDEAFAYADPQFAHAMANIHGVQIRSPVSEESFDGLIEQLKNREML